MYHILLLFYRRKHYTLYSQPNENIRLSCNEINLKSVDHVYIQDEKGLINCKNYFPNTTKLTFDGDFYIIYNSLSTILTRIIPLQRLRKLVINCPSFSFIKLIELLSLTPNVHTLILPCVICYRDGYMSIERSKAFRLVSKNNMITNVTLESNCTLENVRMLITLCPRLECLTIKTHVENLQSTIRFLLERNYQNSRHLCTLCFLTATNALYKKLERLIKSEKLLNDFMLKLIGSKLYLWF